MQSSQRGRSPTPEDEKKQMEDEDILCNEEVDLEEQAEDDKKMNDDDDHDEDDYEDEDDDYEDEQPEMSFRDEIEEDYDIDMLWLDGNGRLKRTHDFSSCYYGFCRLIFLWPLIFLIVIGILLALNGKVFCSWTTEGCSSSESSTRDYNHTHTTTTHPETIFHIPDPIHGADTIARVCSEQSLVDAHDIEVCVEECAAATCCWKGDAPCKNDKKCRPFYPCFNLNLPISEIPTEFNDTDSASNGNTYWDNHWQQKLSLQDVFDACISSRSVCADLCKGAECCWDSDQVGSSNSGCSAEFSCDVYEPCVVLRTAASQP